jgi:hypothetical protein
MTSRSGSSRRQMAALIFGALVSAALGITINVATSAIPNGSYSTLWIIVAVLTGLTLVSTVFFESKRYNEPSSSLDKRLTAAKILRDLAYQSDRIVAFPWRDSASLGDSYPGDISLPQLISLIDQRKSLIITGPPASGKTTLLYKVATYYCTRLVEEHAAEEPLPIPVSAGSWNSEKFDQWFLEFAEQQYGISSRALRKWSTQGEIIVIVDGLDETYNPAALMRAINAWQARYPRCSYLVSTRSEEAKLISSLSPSAIVFSLTSLEKPHAGDDRFKESVASQWVVPEAALRVLVLAALEDGRSYELSEISGLTMLPIEVLSPLLKRLATDGTLLSAPKAGGRIDYTKKSLRREVAP